MFRTSNCGDLTISNVGEIVTLAGWVSRIRDKGFVLWIDLRDRYGITQIIFDEKRSSIEFMDKVRKVHREYVIQIKGKVIERESKNPDIKTGDIEILASSLDILNESITPPFTIENNTDGGEELRMKYRYLDIRRPVIQKNLLMRSNLSLEIRKFLVSKDFVEVETPYLIKSTPEGARDFIVPSRMNKGDFYALPQSPQTFKQLLMVSGMDKYFQIVKCFRDEDLRADRQPEFTQIDIEMSFVDQDDIINMATGLTRHVFKEILDVELAKDFPQLNYHEAMERYGSDKPDIRFDMELKEMSSYVESSDFNAFKSVLDKGGRVKGLVCPNGESYSRKVIDELTDLMKTYYGAKGLAWLKCKDGKLDGGISKYFPNDIQAAMISELEVKDGDIIFMIGDDASVVWQGLGALRLELGKRENLIDNSIWAPLWVVDFPLVEWNSDEERWDALHHPFTAPHPDDIDLIDTDPANVRSLGYDLVLNGYEIGGGSIRIHKRDLQQKAFSLLGVSDEEAEEKFGFLMNAFRYGAPPHGGIAFGFDRIAMLMSGSNQIRDVIAFPKTTSAMSLMDNSPSDVDEKQLDELGLSIKK